MATIDIRNDEVEGIDEIIFSDKSYKGTVVANSMSPYCHGVVRINDYASTYVLVPSVIHANNLIKALNKAITLGWLK